MIKSFLAGALIVASLQGSALAQKTLPRGKQPPISPPVAATPVQPVVAPTLPDPPIPAQHLVQAGIEQCKTGVDQVSRQALNAPYNAQSVWSQVDPTHHVFQSVAGVKNPKNAPPSGMVAIIAAPLAPEKCDTVAVEIYPLAKSCPEVQKMLARGGEVETSLEDIKVITDLQKRRVFLMPAFNDTCVAVTVNSFFGP